MRKITVALKQAITYNDTQSKYIGRLRNWIDVLSENFGYKRVFEVICTGMPAVLKCMFCLVVNCLSVALTGSLYCPSTADAA